MFSVPTIVFLTLSLVLILGALIARIRHLQRQRMLEQRVDQVLALQARRRQWARTANASDGSEPEALASMTRRQRGRNRTRDEDLAFPSNLPSAPTRVPDDCGSDGQD